MNSLFSVYTRMLEFHGRSSVREYGVYFFAMIAVSMALFYLDFSNDWIDPEWGIGPCLGVFSILNFLPNLALSVRRLHDSDRSGAWCMVNFVPLVGPFILLFLLFQPATEKENRFGPVLPRA